AQSTIGRMSRAEVPPASNTPKDSVLVIDDEKTLLDIYGMALAEHFDVVTASSTREAEFILHKRSFKVVIADHLMPGGNGMGFLVRAREEYPHMQRVLVTGYMKPEFLMQSAELQPASKRIMMTGYINPELLSRAVPLAGLSSCLLKPTHPEDLRNAIRKALASK